MESNKVDDILPEGSSLLLEDKLNVLQPARLITIKDTAKMRGGFKSEVKLNFTLYSSLGIFILVPL
jgi:hypothetical protein